MSAAGIHGLRRRARHGITPRRYRPDDGPAIRRMADRVGLPARRVIVVTEGDRRGRAARDPSRRRIAVHVDGACSGGAAARIPPDFAPAGARRASSSRRAPASCPPTSARGAGRSSCTPRARGAAGASATSPISGARALGETRAPAWRSSTRLRRRRRCCRSSPAPTFRRAAASGVRSTCVSRRCRAQRDPTSAGDRRRAAGR